MENMLRAMALLRMPKGVSMPWSGLGMVAEVFTTVTL